MAHARETTSAPVREPDGEHGEGGGAGGTALGSVPDRPWHAVRERYMVAAFEVDEHGLSTARRDGDLLPVQRPLQPRHVGVVAGCPRHPGRAHRRRRRDRRPVRLHLPAGDAGGVRHPPGGPARRVRSAPGSRSSWWSRSRRSCAGGSGTATGPQAQPPDPRRRHPPVRRVALRGDRAGARRSASGRSPPPRRGRRRPTRSDRRCRSSRTGGRPARRRGSCRSGG